MPALGKKLGIFAATIFETISLTGIAPFFPSIAAEQGIPTWLIGMIFSTSPFVSLICSPFIPALMERFGRKFVLVMGLVWISIGNGLLLFVIFTPPYGAILLSFSGRIFIGFGYSWSLISIYTTLTSDFPEEAAKMVALIEIISGIGLTIGPSFGSFMYGMTNYLFTCLTFAGLNLIMVPTLYVLLGKMRDYKILREEPISFAEILSKPVLGM